MPALVQKLQTEVEVRYKPSPKFLDIRGSLASAGVDGGLFPLWRPAESHVELRGPDRYIQFGVARSTFLMRCTDHQNDATQTLLHFFFKQLEMFTKPTLFSVASRYVSVDSPSFDEMVSQTMSFSVNRPLKFLSGYKISDIGWLFDIDIQGATTLLKAGPMKRPQIIDYIMDNDYSEDHALGRKTINEDQLPKEAWFVGLADHAQIPLGEDALIERVTSRLTAFDDFAANAMAGFATLRDSK